MTIPRRQLLKTLALAGVAAPLAAPAIAQTAPDVTWRLTSSFPKSLDLLFGGAETFAKLVHEASDGKFQIEVHEPGDLAPALGALEAVQSGKVEACHTTLAYYWGKDPTFAFATGVPFGMNARMMNAWFYQGGGNDLINDFLIEHGGYALPIGNTGAQMGGWFTKEIKTLDDFKGKRIRCGGFTGTLLQALGAIPVALPAADMVDSLQKDKLDGVEFVAPHDDEKLGLAKVAPFYYYPGWWQGSSAQHVVFNLEKWKALPKSYQAILDMAAAKVNADVQARYDALNPAALKRLVTGGAKLRGYTPDVTDAAYKAATVIYAKAADSNPKFRKMLEAYIAFRNDGYLWWQVCEYTYDNFMIRQRDREAI